MSSSTLPPMTGQGQVATASQQQQQGLPPTGLQQQMSSLNALYGSVQGLSGIGFDPRQQQFAQAQAGGTNELQGDMPMGSSSLDQLARNLAQRYGLPIGQGRIVDAQGNFLMDPQQLADASGGSLTMGEAAAKMNYIGQAISRQQNEQQRSKGIAALQTGLGQVQSRGAGSLASLTSGYYQDLAALYTDPNQAYEATDFSYYIQREQLEIAQELQSRAERLARRQARGQFLSGVGLTVAGIFTGNVAAIGAGATMAGGSAGSTGWF